MGRNYAVIKKRTHGILFLQNKKDKILHLTYELPVNCLNVFQVH